MTAPIQQAAEAICLKFSPASSGPFPDSEMVAQIISATLAQSVPEAGEVAERIATAIYESGEAEIYLEDKKYLRQSALEILTPIFTTHAATVARLRQAMQNMVDVFDTGNGTVKQDNAISLAIEALSKSS